MYKYLLTQIDNFEQVYTKVFKSRSAAMRKMERILTYSDNQVQDIVYHDKRKHFQEFICTNQALRFRIDRI